MTFRTPWLRSELTTKIYTSHAEMSQTFWSKKIAPIITYCLDRQRWWLIIVLVGFWYLLGAFVNLSFLFNVNMTFKTSIILVDQRISNIATIISMTLAVAGFLMGNLAIKDPFAYRLLFIRSKLYPIIYFTLSTITSLIFLSTFRENFENSHAKLYSNLVLSGTYLVVVVLILVAYLFRTIIHFTNSKKIQKFLDDELLNESKKVLFNSLLKIYSQDKMKEFIESENLKVKDFSIDLSNSGLAVSEAAIADTTSMLDSGKFIIDINIKGLSNFISKKSEKDLFIEEISMFECVYNFDNYIFSSTKENNNREKQILKKCLKLRQSLKENENYHSVRNHFENLLEEFAEAGKYKNMNVILESYLKLYKLEMNID